MYQGSPQAARNQLLQAQHYSEYHGTYLHTTERTEHTSEDAFGEDPTISHISLRETPMSFPLPFMLANIPVPYAILQTLIKQEDKELYLIH